MQLNLWLHFRKYKSFLQCLPCVFAVLIEAKGLTLKCALTNVLNGSNVLLTTIKQNGHFKQCGCIQGWIFPFKM